MITVDRIPVLAIFTILFVVAVLVVAGRKGFFGLLGLVVSGVVLFGFMIPALTSGQPAVWVAIGSTAIMFVVLYLAHGVSCGYHVSVRRHLVEPVGDHRPRRAGRLDGPAERHLQ